MTEAAKSKKPVCFVIMPISDVHGYEQGHFGRVYEHLIKPAVIQAGYDPIRADDTTKTDYIVVNIIRRVVESELVICDYSGRNPNVMYELGIRHAFNLPVVLLKDRKTDKVFDIQGLRYTEYDESLRVDSVLKDSSRISKAITETSNADQSSFNSVVQLAGLTAAKVPDTQQVSPDTQLIMSALAALERRVDAVGGDKSGPTYFTFSGSKVTFADGIEASIGDHIFDSRSEFNGELVDIHPASGKIYVRDSSGKVQPFSATSVKSRSLSVLPF